MKNRLLITLLTFFSTTAFCQKFMTRTGEVTIKIIQTKPSYDIITRNDETAIIYDASKRAAVVQVLVKRFELDLDSIYINEKQKMRWENAQAKNTMQNDLLNYTSLFYDRLVGNTRGNGKGPGVEKFPKIIMSMENGQWKITIGAITKIYDSNIRINKIGENYSISGNIMINLRDHNIDNTYDSHLGLTTATDKIELRINATLKAYN